MAQLDRITQPSVLRQLNRRQLDALAAEIRSFLITHVSQTGGHLGPNLGVVELTIALHRVFDSPSDPILFDTGHQSYVHKILTGRGSQFSTLRQQGGLSGYPSRAESPHDWIESSHASSSLSWAEGLAKGLHLRGQDGRTVVVVIGDGALTGGMAWEAMNNIAVEKLPIVIVVNDNGRSYTPTVGGLAEQLAGLRTDRRYEQALDAVKRGVQSTPLVGPAAYDLLHGLKTGIKDVISPQGMFSDLGLKYIGPIDGHDETALERALQQARNFRGPVIVHCITEKGRGYRVAEENDEDRFHAVGRIDPVTGRPLAAPAHTWTEVFGQELAALGTRDPSVVAITAAMLHPVGLAAFQTAFPERTFDVGIAEQHAVASAAGLATAGLHPVVALYSTFLNRAFDQVLMDVALHRLGVTFVLDRAGVTGPDGPSHHGMWDVSLLSLVPGLELAEPRDATRLREALDRAAGIGDRPTVLRYSKEAVPADIDAVSREGSIDVLLDTPDARVLVVGYGAMVPAALEVGVRLNHQGIGARVVDPVWALPVGDELVALASRYELVVVVEDNLVDHGAGAVLATRLAPRGVRVLCHGLPDRFIEQGSRGQILTDLGLTAQQVALSAMETLLAQSVRSPATADDFL